MSSPTVGSSDQYLPEALIEIPTPEEFEREATVETAPVVEQIVQVILLQLMVKSELPATVSFELPWWQAEHVQDALARFQQRGWKTKSDHGVSIFGTARYEIELSK